MVPRKLMLLDISNKNYQESSLSKSISLFISTFHPLISFSFSPKFIPKFYLHDFSFLLLETFNQPSSHGIPSRQWCVAKKYFVSSVMCNFPSYPNPDLSFYTNNYSRFVYLIRIGEREFNWPRSGMMTAKFDRREMNKALRVYGGVLRLSRRLHEDTRPHYELKFVLTLNVCFKLQFVNLTLIASM